MRALAWILALGLVASPAMARAGAGEKDSSGSESATNAPASSKAEPAKAPEPSSLELANEIQQLRDLIESQSAQIQAQNDQLKTQQQQMEKHAERGRVGRERLGSDRHWPHHWRRHAILRRRAGQVRATDLH